MASRRDPGVDESWARVDRYLSDMLLPPDPVLEGTLQASEQAGLPPIQVSALQGKLLHLLARALGARQILEIGSLGGYSGIWLARALPPSGRLVTLELNPRHAEVASSNFAHAGLTERVDLRVGPALRSLAQLEGEHPPPFDLVFIDADKPNNAAYLRWALRLSRPGSVIVVDNVVREGRVADPKDDDSNVRGTRALIELVGAEPRLSATVIQTVGSKGYDGFLLAWVLGTP